ncbi:MAG: pyridine nucleotide-disulfide oxidoreductase [Sulfuricurvum sp. PC08-66]|nr:MAG: pyridine nucleotide-disulfide oxidoreductase [Sulfuricurvum sp. PC08-66]
MRQRVVVIGAGYGGLRAVEHLSVERDLEILLIDANAYHYLQTEVYGYIAGRFDLHDVALDIRHWSYGFKHRNVTFILDRVTSMDSRTKRIHTLEGEYSYDYAIVATGARTNFFSFIEGLRAHSFGVKKLPQAYNFRATFEKLLYEKLDTTHERCDIAQNIVIGGAGLSGVEIAAEMGDVILKHTKSIGAGAQNIRIVLIDAAPTILPGMSRYVIERTQERLEALGIEVMRETFIERVDATHIYCKGKAPLPYVFMIFTGGITASTVELSQACEHNRIGQYSADETLRIAPDVFAIGDCVELHDTKGTLLAPTAQIAEKSAHYVAQSIERLRKGKTLVPFDASIDGVFVALGGNYAVGELWGAIRVKGVVAYMLKKFITKSYYWGLKLRLNTGYKKRSK